MSTYKCENPECGNVFKSNNPLSCPKCDTLEFSTIHIKSNNKIFVIGFLILFIGTELFYFKKGNIYFLRGIVYEHLGSYEAAVSDYTKVLLIDPNNYSAYNNRGYSYHNLGEYNLAIANYTKAIRIEPENATAYRNRGVAKQHIGESSNKDYKKACDLGESVCCEWY
jgi:tetratricopeptide (TPR) repeat protein